MNKKTRKLSILLVVALLLTMVQPVFAKTEVPAKNNSFTPKVMTSQITNRTTKVSVYVYDATTLYIKKGTETIFKKYYAKEGLKTASIAKQKGKSKLDIYLVYKPSGKKGKVVRATVKALPAVSKEAYSKKIKTPTVQKKITNKTKAISVKANKGTTLMVKNDSGIVKKVVYTSTGTKKIAIPKQKEGTTLYFYAKKGNKRSAVVKRTVKDVIAPAKPTVTYKAASLKVKGEKGTKVYVKTGKGAWVFRGIILEKKGLTLSVTQPDAKTPYYSVRLADAAGNKSAAVKANVKVDSNIVTDPIN